MKRAIAVLLLGVLGAVSVAACTGDDDPTAEERAQAAVCQDLDALQHQAEKFVDDIADANFGDALDQASEVETALDELVASAKDLTGAKQQTIQDQLVELQTTLTGVTSLQSLADIGTALDTARSQLEQLATTITDTLSCD